MPYFSMNFCEKTLDDSNCAAFWFGAPDAQAVFLEQIHDAERERIVRADDGEIDFLFLREGEQLGQIFRAEVDAFDRATAVLAPAVPARCRHCRARTTSA